MAWGIDMTDDGHPDDLLGAYVIEACPPDEARLVAEHVRGCQACEAKVAELSAAAQWVGVATAVAPAPALRERVLSAALAARPAASGARPQGLSADDAEILRLLEPYRAQVGELDRLLSALSQPQWLLAAGPHHSVRDMIAHLRDNDAPVAAVAGANFPSTSDVRVGWSAQAHAIIDVAAGQGVRLLERRVGLAGSSAFQRPVREALIQRGFETWTHAEDIRAAMQLPAQAPSAQQVADIVGFILRLLPAAMDAAGRAHEHEAVQVMLTGDGGGTWLADLSADPSDRTVVAQVSLPAESFCRMAAGRLPVSSAKVAIEGDSRAANDFLAVVATMGCD